MVGFLSLPGRLKLAGFLRLLSVELVLRYIDFFVLTTCTAGGSDSEG